jgi:hypothetical protein
MQKLLVLLGVVHSLAEEAVVGLSDDLGLHEKLFFQFLAGALLFFFASHGYW